MTLTSYSIRVFPFPECSVKRTFHPDCDYDPEINQVYCVEDKFLERKRVIKHYERTDGNENTRELTSITRTFGINLR
jgi:hypothetical protein